MNREQRRSKSSTDGALKYLNTPCTITEATQIARGVAEDVVSEYEHHHAPLQVAISLQIEVIKEILINKGIITEEEFRKSYIEKAEDFNRRQREALDNQNTEEDTTNITKMNPSVSDIEIIRERGDN